MDAETIFADAPAPLLTELEVAARLRIESNDPVRLVREMVRRYGVPYTRVGAKMRLTAAQLAVLMEAITCCNSESAAKSGTLEAQFRPRGGASKSVNEARAKLLKARRALMRTG